jgi:hypothetical protein
VNSQVDSLAPKNELTFKCSISCPSFLGSNCELASRIHVNWYSNSNQIFTNTISYNSNDRRLYSFLNESIWTNYVNTDVRRILFKIENTRQTTFKNTD